MIRFFLILVLCAASLPAHAQQGKKLPIEVTAQKTLEWDRDAMTFTARQDAIAKQGTTELHGDTLVAKYKDGPDGKGMTIQRIDATGNVVVISEGSRATGDNGYYDMENGGYAELTGKNLKMVTDTDTVTARDKLTFLPGKKEMNAYGNAIATRGDDRIAGDRLIGRTKSGAGGGSEMDEMEAIGNVVITTPEDTLYGDRAIYYSGPNKATVTGNVRIERGPNIITGSRGEIDMNTNISKIFGGAPNPTSVDSSGAAAPGGDGRVRGVFYPE